jgi:hypothetical protein
MTKSQSYRQYLQFLVLRFPLCFQEIPETILLLPLFLGLVLLHDVRRRVRRFAHTRSGRLVFAAADCCHHSRGEGFLVERRGVG